MAFGLDRSLQKLPGVPVAEKRRAPSHEPEIVRKQEVVLQAIAPKSFVARPETITTQIRSKPKKPKRWIVIAACIAGAATVTGSSFYGDAISGAFVAGAQRSAGVLKEVAATFSFGPR